MSDNLMAYIESRKVQVLLDQQSQRRILQLVLLVSDALMLALAFTVAYWVRFDLQLSLSPAVVPSSSFYARLILILICGWLLLFTLFRLYDFELLLGGTSEYAQVFTACSLGMVLLVFVTFVDPTFLIARMWYFSAWFLSVFFVCSARFLIRRAVYHLRGYGYFISTAAIVGTNSEALTLAEQLASERYSGLRVIGFVDNDQDPSRVGNPALRHAPVVGSMADLETIVWQYGITDLVVASSALDRDQLLVLFEQVNILPHVELRLSSGLFEVLSTGIRVKNAGSVPLMSMNKLRLDPIETLIKSVLDYAVTIPAVLLLLPFFALIALLIRVDSPGPVIYRRRVMGVGGKEFDAFKFRTMHVNGDEILAAHPELQSELFANHKLKEDPRITRVGHWLRKYSLDELPQLFNVLLRQMSLVGPRMITAAEGKKYGRLKNNLLTVKPGITGLWQVSGRSDVSYEERVQIDTYYIRSYSIWLDLHILFVQTLPAVIKGRGAY